MHQLKPVSALDEKRHPRTGQASDCRKKDRDAEEIAMQAAALPLPDEDLRV
ncbi:hypothetical protein OLZ32_15895 [Rhizobium sp. 1AS11]|uniref:hypothetical protein n=1 Tax=Rhizobium acaciae TaxID=2989736 RepID=UPI0022202A59|nr:hypothetical protein [Rhizobium acaciae]MCW1409861.1 hypothetical protein [Rhizobium acaciae]MCW1741887.1 hypothetical protein [Rhizobium acaciae]MCW1750930.1 hypothetical protein [Rhizobium acaciae]